MEKSGDNNNIFSFSDANQSERNKVEKHIGSITEKPSHQKEIISDSKKYKVIIEPDDNGEQTTYTVYNAGEGYSKHDKNKYVIVKVVIVENNEIIHEYKQHNGHSPLNKFITISGKEWWFGGRNYMLKLFVNCESGEVFDDPNKRELSTAYKGGSEFIWTGPVIVSPNGQFMFVNGCMWSFPYEWRLYDIRNITNIFQIDLYDYLVLKEFDEGDERLQYEDDWLGDDDLFKFEFVTDYEITVKYYHNREWKYFNTIDLSYLYPIECVSTPLRSASEACNLEPPTERDP